MYNFYTSSLKITQKSLIYNIASEASYVYISIRSIHVDLLYNPSFKNCGFVLTFLVFGN